MLQGLAGDLRHALRLHFGRRSPRGLAAAALLALAVGIGGCAVILGVAEAILFHPLPYPEPERLVRIAEDFPAKGVEAMSSSPARVADYRRDARSFSALAAYRHDAQTLDLGETPERLDTVRASGGFFRVLGVRPEVGTAFSERHEREADARVVVLSHDLWQRRFGGDRAVVGRTLRLDGEPYTVLGVMPAGFRFPESPALWRPLALGPEERADRQSHYLRVVARLAPGATVARARAEMDVLAGRLARQFPEADAGWRTRVRSLEDEVTEPVRPALHVLLAAGFLLLAVVCGNVANLLLARAASRGREIAVRATLGAGVGRLLRQLLAESVSLTLLGGLLGLGLAAVAARALVASTPELAPRWSEIGVGGRAALLTLSLAAVAGVAAGAPPALRLLRSGLRPGLAEGGRASLGWRRNRLAGSLVAAQIALSFVLLAGAGLLGRSFQRLMQNDPGFQPAHVLTFRVELPKTAYPEGPQRTAFFDRALARLRALPGVESAGAASRLPLAGGTDFMPYRVPGRPAGDKDYAAFYAVTPGYFETLRMRVLSGRGLAEGDRAAAPPATVLSASLARRLFPAGDAAGKTVLLGFPPDAVPTTVVGIVADVRAAGLEEAGGPAIYELSDAYPPAALSLCVRTAGDPEALVPAVRRAVAEIDRGQAVDEVAALGSIVGDSVAGRRLALWVMGGFAAVSLVLAVVGLYAALSHLVGRATREIGVRVALGAEPRHIRGLVLRFGALVLVPGLLLGAAAALASGRLLASQLYGVGSADALTYAAVAVLLAALALLACLAPARRALRVEPAEALEAEA